MTVQPRILVVDDEPAILRAIGIALQAHGYEVDAAASGKQALAKASGSSHQLVILDLGLPDLDGLELLRQLRVLDRTVPIVILSAWQEIDTRVAALDLGADDFVPKPFSMPELLARVRVALRHADHAGRMPLEATSIVRGPIVIDTARREVRARGELIALTRTQYQLLICFARHPDRVLTRTAITAEVWGPDATIEPENLRVVVSHLRKRIEPDASEPHIILTEPGVGYRFCPED
ncbi:MAG: response regulator transcription factor [Thermoleophilia bacterium]|nr:response regulator transcription factor [Thermoleophilia bacterium]